jgi:hypothetical protein
MTCICHYINGLQIFFWSSSPYLPSKEYLVNHGLICSGILPSDYKCFANGAGIGIINEENRTTFFKQHKQHIQQECNDSIETALLEEVASYEDLKTIDIMTDARLIDDEMSPPRLKIHFDYSLSFSL